MSSLIPEQIDDGSQPQEEVVIETPQISNLPDFAMGVEDDDQRNNPNPDPESKTPQDAIKDVLRIGEHEIPLDVEVSFSDELKAPLKHVKEQYMNLRGRYGELGQKEEAARQETARLKREADQLAREKAEMDEVKSLLASGNKKEAIDKLFMKSGINPATWWPQFFDETAHLYEQRSVMDDKEKAIAQIQAENELLKKRVEEETKTKTVQKEAERLQRELEESTAKAGLTMEDVNGIYAQVNTAIATIESGRESILPPETVRFIKAFKSASPSQQLNMLVNEATVGKATNIALEIVNELDSELAKDDNVVVDLRSQILNPYRNQQMTREDFKSYLKTRWSSKLNGKARSSDEVELVEETKEQKPVSTNNTKGTKPLSMWELKR